jgi:hypothetical protein
MLTKKCVDKIGNRKNNLIQMTDGGKILRKRESMNKEDTFPLLTTVKYNVLYCIIWYFVWSKYRTCDGGFVGLWCIWTCNCSVRLLEWCAVDKSTLIYYMLDNSKPGTSHEVFMSSFFFLLQLKNVMNN